MTQESGGADPHINPPSFIPAEIDAPGLPGRCHAPSPPPEPRASQVKLHRPVRPSREMTSKSLN